MPLVTEAFLRREADRYRLASSARIQKTEAQLLKEAAATSATSFDVFLSHSVQDAKVILGLYGYLQRMGFSVYVDWIVDPKLDRTNVTAQTAEHLRGRMRQSKTLIYAQSNNATSSKWMPWELGYFDGYRSAVAVLPIAKTDTEKFSGQEYLGLYPNVDASTAAIWVNKGAAPDRLFGKSPASHPSFKRLNEWILEKAA